MKLNRRKLLLLVLAAACLGLGFQAMRKPVIVEDPLIAGFRKTTVASVADAVCGLAAVASTACVTGAAWAASPASSACAAATAPCTRRTASVASTSARM